jgi:hypothetical protein
MADPAFTNAAANTFTLSPGSPANDAGITLPAIATDFAGNQRLQGKGYGIGAVER